MSNKSRDERELYRQDRPLSWWAWDEKWVTLTCPDCQRLFDVVKNGSRHLRCEECQPRRKPLHARTLKHGTEYAYRGLKCRCVECLAYKSAQNKRTWKPRAAA